MVTVQCPLLFNPLSVCTAGMRVTKHCQPLAPEMMLRLSNRQCFMLCSCFGFCIYPHWTNCFTVLAAVVDLLGGVCRIDKSRSYCPKRFYVVSYSVLLHLAA